jgi:O-antigen/teichoic acid export membrane protein
VHAPITLADSIPLRAPSFEPETRSPSAATALGGTVRIFIAEALFLPTGLVTAGYLTRTLGATGYGLFTLAVTIVIWVEWSIVSLFARASFKLVAEADDWRPVATTLVRLHLAAGIAGGLLVAAACIPISAALKLPEIRPYLLLLAIDVPLFVVAAAYRAILVGTGDYARRAWASVARSMARLILIFALVAAGLSIAGAVLALIGASVADLLVARGGVRAPLLNGPRVATRSLLGFMIPVALAAITTRLLDRLDVVLLRALGESVAAAGLYGAAQNLAIVPALLSQSAAPVVLATTTRMLRDAGLAEARAFAAQALRGVMLVVPFAAVAAGSADELVPLIFGGAFAPASQAFSILIYGAVALLFVLIASAVLTAANRPGLTFAIVAPLLPIAVAAHVVAIPRWHAVGAAAVTAGVNALAAVLAGIATTRCVGARPSLATTLRVAAVSVVAHAAASSWATPGIAVVVKLAVLALGVPVAYAIIGEITAAERRLVVAAITRRFTWRAA